MPMHASFQRRQKFVEGPHVRPNVGGKGLRREGD